MTALHSARCPDCGAPATGTLWSDSSVPLYACGTYGDRASTVHRQPPPVDAVANLAELTPDDAAAFVDLVSGTYTAPSPWHGPLAVADYEPCQCAIYSDPDTGRILTAVEADCRVRHDPGWTPGGSPPWLR